MAIENPSAKRFANPKIITMEGDKDASTTPATITNVVTDPSVAP